MEHTGHRSLDGVRSYKRISQEQQATLTVIMNLSAPEPKRQHVAMASSQKQHGVAPTQLSMQDCSNFTININYGNM